MKRWLYLVLIGALLLSAGRPAHAEMTTECMGACDDADSECQNQSKLPNDLDASDAREACQAKIKACYQQCEQDRARELEDQKGKAQSGQEEQQPPPETPPQTPPETPPQNQ